MREEIKQFPWVRILAWAVVLGLAVSLLVDWQHMDRLPINALWRVLIVAAGGTAGWILNLFTGFYVGMATNVIESMGVFRFSGETPTKIRNGFIFVVALVGAIISALVIH